MLMEESYLTSLFINSFSDSPRNFKVEYTQPDGSVLHGLVKEVSEEHFEVLIEEKDVIIHCTRDENGVLSCKLNTNKNPEWVDGVSKEVAMKVNK